MRNPARSGKAGKRGSGRFATSRRCSPSSGTPGAPWSGVASRAGSPPLLIPLSMLAVSKRILDAVQSHATGQSAAAEFLVSGSRRSADSPALGSLLARAIGYFDALLADRYTRYVSIRVMEHASRLDLASYEDPVFYDKLERARVQATDRIAMIQAIGTVLQQIIAAVSLSAGVLWFSPWLLVLLVVAVVPAFLGESHFAFLGYAQNIRQTPVRRQLDYLRTLGASKESAKELKLFGLSGFLSRRVRAAVEPDLRRERATAAPAARGPARCSR